MRSAAAAIAAPSSRERSAARQAVDQPQPQRRLQSGDAPADRRMIDVELARRRRQRAAARQNQKKAQVFPIHR